MTNKTNLSCIFSADDMLFPGDFEYEFPADVATSSHASSRKHGKYILFILTSYPYSYKISDFKYRCPSSFDSNMLYFGCAAGAISDSFHHNTYPIVIAAAIAVLQVNTRNRVGSALYPL